MCEQQLRNTEENWRLLFEIENEDPDRSMDLNGLIRFFLGFFPNPEQQMLDHGNVVPPESKLQRFTQIVNLPEFDPERSSRSKITMENLDVGRLKTRIFILQDLRQRGSKIGLDWPWKARSHGDVWVEIRSPDGRGAVATVAPRHYAASNGCMGRRSFIRKRSGIHIPFCSGAECSFVKDDTLCHINLGVDVIQRMAILTGLDNV